MRTIVSFVFVAAMLAGCGGSGVDSAHLRDTACQVRNTACTACRRVCDATDAACSGAAR